MVGISEKVATPKGSSLPAAVDDCGEERRATDRERLTRDIMRFSFRVYREAWACNPHDDGDYQRVAQTARLGIAALLNIVEEMNQPADGSAAADGATEGNTEGHTPDA